MGQRAMLRDGKELRLSKDTLETDINPNGNETEMAALKQHSAEFQPAPTLMQWQV